ncbi:IS630 family transposase [Laspinema olomoucense]|uniref:IS630 family transposase n=1 Tax=Laspinema olomoucense TaxID=3231600 RepID=UPI0021BB0DC6|nr:IS630 family transposase [Laspinema sp. D3d]MCT7975682.1 IS630 family transposase [Laspinema sp. D3d]
MKAYSVDLRQKIFDVYHTEKISQRQLAQRFHVATSFVIKLLKQYRETGNIAPKPFRGGVKLTLNLEQLEILAGLIEVHNDATLEELCELLKEKTGVSISRATMGRMTQRLKMTVKKKSLYPNPKETERVQKLRVEFWEKIRSIKAENLVFIDEAGANLAMLRLYARALVGKRAYGSKPTKRGKNVSMIAAISLSKIITSVNLLGAADGVTFESFIVNKLVPNLWEGACVVLDNSTIHQGEEIEKAMIEAGAKLIYLPPYSPDFNPIENMWSKVKSILRSLGARTYQALDQAIAQAFSQVCVNDLQHWFTHCCYCTSSN